MQCHLCAVNKGVTEPVANRIHSADQWAVNLLLGYEVPGWVAVQARRHVEDVGALTAVEASELAGLTRVLAQGLRCVVPTDRVYLASFGENFPHFHLLVAAQSRERRLLAKGPKALLRKDEWIDQEEAVRVFDCLVPFLTHHTDR